MSPPIKEAAPLPSKAATDTNTTYQLTGNLRRNDLRDELIAAALTYAGHGWSVFPCRPGQKTPATRNGFKDATTNPAVITAWWSNTPDCNVGIATEASGLAVLDIDGTEGEAALAHVEARLGSLVDDAGCSITARGVQFFFTGAPRSTAGLLGLPGIDVRGVGGYVVAPPSVHPTGWVYTWSEHRDWRQTLPSWPDHLAAVIERASQPRPRPSATYGVSRPLGSTSAYVAAAFKGELSTLEATQPGGRNHALNKAAYSLARLVVDARADRQTVEQALLNSAARIGLDELEARRTVTSAFTARGLI